MDYNLFLDSWLSNTTKRDRQMLKRRLDKLIKEVLKIEDWRDEYAFKVKLYSKVDEDLLFYAKDYTQFRFGKYRIEILSLSSPQTTPRPLLRDDNKEGGRGEGGEGGERTTTKTTMINAKPRGLYVQITVYQQTTPTTTTPTPTTTPTTTTPAPTPTTTTTPTPTTTLPPPTTTPITATATPTMIDNEEGEERFCCRYIVYI